MKLVLVVGGERRSVEALRSMLGSAGYRVAVTADGRAGLDFLAVERPAVILADVAPSASASDLGRAVRSDPRIADIPIVIVSESAASEARSAFDDYDSFLRKPIAPEVVVPLVAHLTRYGRPARKSL